MFVSFRLLFHHMFSFRILDFSKISEEGLYKKAVLKHLAKIYIYSQNTFDQVFAPCSHFNKVIYVPALTLCKKRLRPRYFEKKIRAAFLFKFQMWLGNIKKMVPFYLLHVGVDLPNYYIINYT